MVVKVDRFAIHLFISDFTEHPGIELGPEEKKDNRRWPLQCLMKKAAEMSRSVWPSGQCNMG